MSTEGPLAAPKSPLGVIQWQGRIVCYEHTEGDYRVVVFGSGEPVPMTPELQDALAHDEGRQLCKDLDDGG